LRIVCSFHAPSGASKIEEKKELLFTVKKEKGKEKDPKKKKFSTLGKVKIGLDKYSEAGTIRTDILQLETPSEEKVNSICYCSNDFRRRRRRGEIQHSL
jgi:hypothetical protein